MDNDNFNIIFQQLNSGQNPTLQSNDDGIIISNRRTYSDTNENIFGFVSVNEEAIFPTTSDK